MELLNRQPPYPSATCQHEWWGSVDSNYVCFLIREEVFTINLHPQSHTIRYTPVLPHTRTGLLCLRKSACADSKRVHLTDHMFNGRESGIEPVPSAYKTPMLYRYTIPRR